MKDDFAAFSGSSLIPLEFFTQTFPLSLRTMCPTRCDSVYAYRKYSVCGGSGSFYDPSQCPRHHDHPHLSTLALLQTHCGACRRRAQGIYTDAALWFGAGPGICCIRCQNMFCVWLYLLRIYDFPPSPFAHILTTTFWIWIVYSFFFRPRSPYMGSRGALESVPADMG